MNDSNTQRFHLSCQTPVGWLRAISDGSHLIHLDWNQIGWTDPDRPDHVSRETITQLMAYFAGQSTNFTIPLRPPNISPARQHCQNIMAIIYRCHRVVRKNGVLGHYWGVKQLAHSHKDNVAHKGSLIIHEKSQLDEGQLILT